MKRFDLVSLINDKAYLDKNITKDMRGIVINVFEKDLEVIFLNNFNVGQYATVKINKSDVEKENEELPQHILLELNNNLEKIIKNSSDKLEDLKIKEYDIVELLVEEERYSKFGIHKGDKGCVVSDKAIKNYVDVDFFTIDKNGKCLENSIAVKIEDLKIIK